MFVVKVNLNIKVVDYNIYHKYTLTFILHFYVDDYLKYFTQPMSLFLIFFLFINRSTMTFDLITQSHLVSFGMRLPLYMLNDNDVVVITLTLYQTATTALST